MTFIDLTLRDDEAHDLRAVLEQTARPGSLQTTLIHRIDAALEEAKRPRRKRKET